MSDPKAKSPEAAGAAKLAGEKSKAFKVTLVNHREVCKAFGISTDVLMRAVRKGEFPTPHSLLGSYYLFDRATIEHRLDTGTWPKGTKFRGTRHVAADDEG